jgi:hypothetical protein
MKIKSSGGTKASVKGASTKLNKRDAALRAAGTSSKPQLVPEPAKLGEGQRRVRLALLLTTGDVR